MDVSQKNYSTIQLVICERTPFGMRGGANCSQSVNRFDIVTNDNNLKNFGSLTDRKNVKPVREPFLKPKTTLHMIKRHIVHETLSLYMDANQF